MYIPILGAIALASGTILEKIVLKKKHMDIKLYQTVMFLAAVLVMAPFVYFFWRMGASPIWLKAQDEDIR